MTVPSFDVADLRDALIEQLRDAGTDPRRSGDEISHFCPICEPERREPPRKTRSASSTVKLRPDGTPQLRVCCYKSCTPAETQRATGISLRSLEFGCEQRGVERSSRPKQPSSPGAPKYSPPSEAELTAAQARFASSPVQRALTDERGWALLTMIELGLGLGDDGRVWIPMRNESGELLSVERYDPFGGSARKVEVPKGAERHLLAPPNGVRDSEVYITEGVSDCIAALSCGLPAVGAPSATTWKPAYTETLVRAGVKTAYVIGDSDEPGRKFAPRVAKDLTKQGIAVRTIDLAPDRTDGYDLTDWLQDHPDDAAAETLKSLAHPYVPSKPDERQTTERGPTERFELVRPSLSNVTPIRLGVARLGRGRDAEPARRRGGRRKGHPDRPSPRAPDAGRS